MRRARTNVLLQNVRAQPKQSQRTQQLHRQAALRTHQARHLIYGAGTWRAASLILAQPHSTRTAASSKSKVRIDTLIFIWPSDKFLIFFFKFIIWNIPENKRLSFLTAYLPMETTNGRLRSEIVIRSPLPPHLEEMVLKFLNDAVSSVNSSDWKEIKSAIF